MKLEGKIALVTGAGSGIGRAIAERFAAEGARVGVNDMDADAAQKVADGLGKGMGVACPGDVTSADDVARMFQKVDETFGALDVLVANAGIAHTGEGELDRFNEGGLARLQELMSGEGIKTHLRITENLSEKAWRKMIDVHMTGTFLCAKEAIKRMSPKGGGAIVNMSSVAGLAGLEAVPHYSAAKAGILGFTRALAGEVGSQNIRVNAICPGFVDTAMTSPIAPELHDMLTQQMPLLRWGKPEDIAAAALYLASDDAGWVTGQWLSPNGGLVMQ